MLNNKRTSVAFLILAICFVARSLSQERSPFSKLVLQARTQLNIMMISLEPGFEDFSTLTSYRFQKGANTLSVYVTNGEAGESDSVADLNPPQVAAARREEAWHAMRTLEAGAFFLNMPDVKAAPDTTTVLDIWERDTLTSRLRRIVDIFKPNIVLLMPDFLGGPESPRMTILRTTLLQMIQTNSKKTSKSAWDVSRMFVERSDKSSAIGVRGEKSNTLGDKAAAQYGSLKIQMSVFAHNGIYEPVYPKGLRNVKSFEEGLSPVPKSLRSLDASMRAFTSSLLQLKSEKIPPEQRNKLLRTLRAINDTVQVRLAHTTVTQAEKQVLLHWNLNIDELRNTLLGVSVSYSLSEKTVAPRQLTFLRIDTVVGLSPGTTEILFPGTSEGWIVNEASDTKLPLKLHEDYRLLSPRNPSFDLPLPEYADLNETIGKPLYFFILHNAREREQSFIYRGVITIFYAPKFSTEILTPIVRGTNNERVPVRLTNHSRDGVRDSVFVSDSLASTQKLPFRLPEKESIFQDTLLLSWKKTLPEGTYLSTVQIGGFPVARFVARVFDLRIDTTKRIGAYLQSASSPLAGALRRLGVHPVLFGPGALDSARLSQVNVLLVDRRAMTFHPEVAESKSIIRNFVEGGGHLVILSQEASVWNRNPLWDQIQLSPSFDFNAEFPLISDSLSPVLRTPNIIGSRDWEQWLFQRNFNHVLIGAPQNFETIVKGSLHGEVYPMVVAQVAGKGKIVYIDLNLNPQLMNISPGALRFLANLISN